MVLRKKILKIPRDTGITMPIIHFILQCSIICFLLEASVYTDTQIAGCLITYLVIKLKMFTAIKQAGHQLWAENKSSAAESCVHMIKQPGTFKGLCKTQIIIFKRNSILFRCFFSLLSNGKMI